MIYNCMYRAFKNGPIIKGKWNTNTGLIEGVIKESFYYKEPSIIDRFKDYVVDFDLTRSYTEYMYSILVRNLDVNLVVMFAPSVTCYVSSTSVIYKVRGEVYPRGEGNIFDGPHLHIGYLKTVPLNFSHQVYQNMLYVVNGENGDYIYTQYGERPVTFKYDTIGHVIGMSFLELSNTPDNVLGFYTNNGKAELLYKN